MPVIDVELPSGLSGQVRPFKVSEANTLASQGKNDDATLAIVPACWIKTHSASPYTLTKDGEIPWGNALTGDRLVALIEVRVATYGPNYDFEFRCLDKECAALTAWRINLKKDLKYTPYSEKARNCYSTNGGIFDLVLPVENGKRAKAQMNNVATQQIIKKYANQLKNEPMTAALAGRIVSIADVHDNDRLAWLTSLDMGPVMEILSLLDEYEGGVDTAIQVRCKKCGEVHEIDLPFTKDFYLPKRKLIPENLQQAGRLAGTMLAVCCGSRPLKTYGTKLLSCATHNTVGRD